MSVIFALAYIIIILHLFFPETWVHTYMTHLMKLNLRQGYQEMFVTHRSSSSLQGTVWFVATMLVRIIKSLGCLWVQDQTHISKQVYSAFLMKTSQGSDSTNLPNEVVQWYVVWEWQFSKKIKVKVRTSKPDNCRKVHFWLNAGTS